MAASSRVWFITGSSSGFGYLLAKEVLRRGERVIATARNVVTLQDLGTEFPETARTLSLDVTMPAEIESVARQAIAAFGYVDVVVNNAGYGLGGAIEEVTEDEFEPMFQTNIYGLIRTTRAAPANAASSLPRCQRCSNTILSGQSAKMGEPSSTSGAWGSAVSGS